MANWPTTGSSEARTNFGNSSSSRQTKWGPGNDPYSILPLCLLQAVFLTVGISQPAVLSDFAAAANEWLRSNSLLRVGISRTASCWTPWPRCRVTSDQRPSRSPHSSRRSKFPTFLAGNDGNHFRSRKPDRLVQGVRMNAGIPLNQNGRYMLVILRQADRTASARHSENALSPPSQYIGHVRQRVRPCSRGAIA